jgi:hypothetical protein
MNRNNMKPRKTKKSRNGIGKLGKKAFITDIIVDFWAYITFVLVVIVFAIFYKWGAEAKLQQIDDVQDITYGNYLAQVYLRSPVVVGDQDMTMAELITLYDYNQTMEKAADPSYAEMVQSGFKFFFGSSNDMWDEIEEITEEYVETHYDTDNCYVFSIKGNGFEYSEFSYFGCPSGNAFSIASALPQFGVPVETYVTYLPSVDPRQKPIEIYSIYNLERLIELYTPKGFEDMNSWRRDSLVSFCINNPEIENCVEKGIGETEE